MRKKLAAYVSLLTMLSSFLIGPINVLAEQLDNPLDIEQVDQDVISTETEDDLLNIEQVGVDRSETAVTDKEVDLTQSDNNHSAEELAGLPLMEKESKIESGSNGLDSEKSNPQQEDYLKEPKVSLPASSEVNFDLSVTDYNGKPLDKPVGQWDSFRVNLAFNIPNDSALKNGSETIIQLPDELLIGDNITDSIKDGTGVVVANVTVDGSNKALTLTYTDYVESHSDIKGNFFFYVRVDTSVIQKGELLKLDIDIDGETKPFEIEFEGVDYTAPPFSKAGWFLDNDPHAHTIQYYLAVNRSQQAFKNAVVKDSLISPNITYDPDSFVIKKGTWVRNAEDTDWILVNEKEVKKEIVLSEDKRSFTINFGDIQQDDHFAIFYKAAISDDVSVTNEDIFSNKAALVSDDTVITEETINTIYKGSGGEAEGAHYSIKILKLNEDNQPLGGAIFEVKEMPSKKIHGEIETNDAGEGSIDNLLKKDYEITEKTAPEGYKLLDEPVVIKAEDFKSEEPVVEKRVINQKETETEKETTRIKGKKIWEDKNNQDGLRPDSIQVQLYADEKVFGKPVTLSEDNNWTHTWDDLPKLSKGKVIKYTVKEVTEVPGYTTEVTEISADNVVITNKHVTEKTTEVTGQKTWEDNQNEDKLRPETITVNLLANGKVIDSQTVSAKGNWQYSFTDLRVHEDGELIIYTVTEDRVPGYTTQIEGYDILNTYTPDKTDLTVTKAWEDKNNQDGLRPDSIQVQLYQDEKVFGKPVTLSKENNWTHTWDNLPKLVKEKTVKYTVKEVTKIPDYTTEITETSAGNMVITNKHVTEKTGITGQKTWKDNYNQDGKRPETITVNLLANGKVIDSQTVSEKDNWQYIFTGLPVYEDGELIIYTVTEDRVPGYTTQIEGYDILNTYKPKKTSLTVTKAWEDKNNQDGLRPDNIQVQLYANGELTKERVTLSQDNNWTYTWAKLPKLVKGKTVKYTVKELTKIPDYTTEVTETSAGNVVITNKHVTEKTGITGQKTWKDNHDQDGKRPETITVNVLANGKVIDSQTVSEKDNWQYSFTGLPVYEDGELIIYTVTEDRVPGYTTQIEGYDILNTYKPKKTGLTVTKAWEDKNNQDGLRPDNIQVQLYANGELTKERVTLSQDNNWTYTWANLPKLSNGKVIKYTVKEVTKIPDYTTEVTETSAGNMVITNKYVTEKTDVTGQKTWKDNHNQDGKRPETITVNLLANGKVIDSQTVSEKDNWQYSFTGLPVYKDGELIIYTVTEDRVPGYTTQINGYDILNTYRPKKTGLTVTKAWEDNHNQDGLRPDSIQVQLYADGEVFGEPVTLSKDNNWTYTWDNLPKLSNGKVIKYTVKELTKIPDYATEVTETSAGNVVITNKHVTEKTGITGQKTWKDNQNEDNLRPETITVNLLANGKVIDSQTVSEKDNWQYSFTGLPVYEDGELIIYTVTEDQVPNYTTQIKGYDILNTYRPKKTSLTVTKAWEDKNNQDGLRPDSIQVQLYQDEKVFGKPVTLSKENNWTYTWDNLPKLSNGKVIKYTVKEVTKVPDYTTEITETSAGNVVITNKHVVKKLTEVPLDEPKNNKPSTPYTEVKNKKALPQTSEKANNWVMLLGLLLIGVTLMMSKRKTE